MPLAGWLRWLFSADTPGIADRAAAAVHPNRQPVFQNAFRACFWKLLDVQGQSKLEVIRLRHEVYVDIGCGCCVLANPRRQAGGSVADAGCCLIAPQTRANNPHARSKDGRSHCQRIRAFGGDRFGHCSASLPYEAGRVTGETRCRLPVSSCDRRSFLRATREPCLGLFCGNHGGNLLFCKEKSEQLPVAVADRSHVFALKPVTHRASKSP